MCVCVCLCVCMRACVWECQERKSRKRKTFDAYTVCVLETLHCFQTLKEKHCVKALQRGLIPNTLTPDPKSGASTVGSLPFNVQTCRQRVFHSCRHLNNVCSSPERTKSAHKNPGPREVIWSSEEKSGFDSPGAMATSLLSVQCLV